MNNIQVNLIPFMQWNKYHQWPKVSQFSNWIKNPENHNFHGIVRRIDGKLYINEDNFFKWVQARQRLGYENDFQALYFRTHGLRSAIGIIKESNEL